MTQTDPSQPAGASRPAEPPRAAEPSRAADPAAPRPRVRRSSKQRDAVAERLTAQDGFRSAQEIYAELRAGGNSIGLATVYRALQGMVEDGEVDALRSAGDGEAVYRRCSESHHHHLVCRSCGTAVEVEGGPVERWTHEVAAAHGFTGVRHVLEVFGTCAACAAGADGSGAVGSGAVGSGAVDGPVGSGSRGVAAGS